MPWVPCALQQAGQGHEMAAPSGAFCYTDLGAFQQVPGKEFSCKLVRLFGFVFY